MRRLLKALPLVLTLASFGAASAEEKLVEKHLNIDWQEAHIVKLDKAAASVIVGDPTIADVSLEDPNTVILFGKSPGETNLIVFDSNHKLVVSASVTVTPEVARHVSIIGPVGGAPNETLYACGNRCVRILSPSDIDFKATVSTQSSAAASTQQSASSTAESQGSSAGGAAPAPAQ